MTSICADCLSKKLSLSLNRKVSVEKNNSLIVGELIGFKVNGGALKVVIRQKKGFYVFDNVTRLILNNSPKEEINYGF
jgi:hypothetical protein